MSVATQGALWGQRWARMQAREQRMVMVALMLVLGALVWLVLLQPPWKALERARQQRVVLAQQEQTMLQLQAAARTLQARPVLDRQAVLAGLQSAVARLGGEVNVQLLGDTARLTVAHVPAAALASWLSGAQIGAGANGPRLVPIEARLTRSGTAAAPQWGGTLVYRLPAEGGKVGP
jgi:general secretion pathway protein M